MSSRRVFSLRVLLIALLVLHSLPDPGVARSLTAQLEKVEELLEKQSWKKAAEQSARLRAKLLKKDVSKARELLQPIAQTLVIQAIAEANLGQDRDALWHWHSAQNYLDDLPQLELSAYGRANALLAGRSLHDQPALEERVEIPDDRKGYQEVKIRYSEKPEYPRSLRKSGYEGVVRIQLIIGTGGRAYQPVIKSAGLVPTMAFPALEALSKWQFQAATFERKEIPVYFELEIRYQ